MKKCNCGFETENEEFNFCPLCGKDLIILELESDGTYKANRYACRILDDRFESNIIYYFKTSPINPMCWIYETMSSERYVYGCHYSKVLPLELEAVQRCVLRVDGKCGKTTTCKTCYSNLKQKYPLHFK